MANLKSEIVTPNEYYEKLIESDQILRDPQQTEVIAHLQRIYEQLIKQISQTGVLQKLKQKRSPAIQGLYLWGDVGIGKTFLMDSFFICLPFKKKLRIHFHEFMKMIHTRLQLYKGLEEPLIKIAKELAKEYAVICLDELVVSDITDAMLLAGLFRKLYLEKICLLFTSNTPPDELYLKGIQRDSFLPAIELIKQHSQIIHLSSKQDYRYRHYQRDAHYYTPLNSITEDLLESQFNSLTRDQPIKTGVIKILDRNILVKKRSDNVVWFEFLALCGVPRSQQDYLELTRQFSVIIISDLPVIKPEQNDLARAFINLVDVCYDSHTPLIIAAEKPIDEIYTAGKMVFEFTRTRSRLIEMQTESWRQQAL